MFLQNLKNVLAFFAIVWYNEKVVENDCTKPLHQGAFPMNYSQMSREQLLAQQKELVAVYEEKKALGLSLDLSRGKPGSKQAPL